MPNLFQRRSAAVCYYCQSTIKGGSLLQPDRLFDPSYFRCPHCGCWNRYDTHGQIIGGEPAMHDESLNVDSFTKRGRGAPMFLLFPKFTGATYATGSPDRNHFPSLSSSSRPSLFCHTCQTNQTLIVNLLASFLPSPEDPSYASRSLQLPEYSASLQSRYPPVCSSCAPGVEAEIAKRNEMARTRALGSALKVSSGRSSPADRTMNPVTGRTNQRKNLKPNMRFWKARGVLWLVGLVLAISGNIVGALNVPVPLRLRTFVPLLPVLVLLSLLWAFWEPTYSLQQRSRVSGSEAQVEGWHAYKILQLQAWLSRFVSSLTLLCAWYRPEEWDVLCIYNSQSWQKREMYFSCALVFEITVLLLSYFSIRTHKPPQIRLVDAQHALKSLSNPLNSGSQPSIAAGPAQPDDLLASLSLSNNPLFSSGGANAPVNPVFGRPSLGTEASAGVLHQPRGLDKSIFTGPGDGNDNAASTHFYAIPEIDAGGDADAMDWEPSSPLKKKLVRQRTDDILGDGSWLRQQRFFPPEEPTGLEGLLMRTRLVDDEWVDRNSRAPLSSMTPFSENYNDGRGSITGDVVRWHWGWVYWISIVPVVMLGVGIVLDRRWSS